MANGGGREVRICRDLLLNLEPGWPFSQFCGLVQLQVSAQLFPQSTGELPAPMGKVTAAVSPAFPEHCWSRSPVWLSPWLEGVLLGLHVLTSLASLPHSISRLAQLELDVQSRQGLELVAISCLGLISVFATMLACFACWFSSSLI